MPKIKDLGIKVIPETMKPPEVGGGGCTDCTVQAFSICGGTQQQGCTDCTFQQFSICGGTQGCTDCTVQAFSICGGTQQQVCTAPFSFCRYPTLGGCTDCTIQPFSICGGTCGFRSFCACTQRPTFACGPISVGCGAISRVCAGSIDPTIAQQPPAISREQIAALKDSLRQQIAALEEHEKTIGPKTVEEIDAREKQLTEELAQLKARRKDLK